MQQQPRSSFWRTIRLIFTILSFIGTFLSLTTAFSDFNQAGGALLTFALADLYNALGWLLVAFFCLFVVALLNVGAWFRR